MTSPTLSAELQTALDELQMARESMTHALATAKAIGLVPYRFASIQHAIDDTLHAGRELNAIIRALTLAYPNAPL